MGTEVLRPQDCLTERLRQPTTSFHRRRNGFYNGNINANPRSSAPNHRKNPVTRHDQKKRSNNNNHHHQRSSSTDDLKPKVNGGHVTGQVTILRRGESLSSLDSKVKESESQPTPSEQMATPKQIKVGRSAAGDVYAGSAVYTMSPSPRSLPLPSFAKSKGFDDSATKDLRRLLRLE